MLKPVARGPAVIVCNSCRRSEVSGGGAALVGLLRRTQENDPAYGAIAIEEMACLFACSAACTVHVRAPDKIAYVMGHFEPSDEAARAILDYAVAHAASAEGQVPYREWPEGVKGHFLTRMPPEGYVVT